MELIGNEVCAVSLNTQSQTVKGIVHTSTNRLEEKVNLECDHSWESDMVGAPNNIVQGILPNLLE